jgi:hypothetical protein
LTIPDSCVSNLGEGLFKVTNEDIGYTVEINTSNSCSNSCQLMCRICKVCIHTSKCSCPDYTLRGLLCKHIHVTIRFKFPQLYQEQHINEENEDKINADSIPPENKISGIPKILESLKKENNIKEETLKHKKQKAEMYIDFIQKGIAKCENDSLLDEINTKLFQLNKLLELNDKEQKEQFVFKGENKPPNTNIPPIRKFHSTKRKFQATSKSLKLDKNNFKKIKKELLGEYAGKPLDQDEQLSDHSYSSKKL